MLLSTVLECRNYEGRFPIRGNLTTGSDMSYGGTAGSDVSYGVMAGRR